MIKYRVERIRPDSDRWIIGYYKIPSLKPYRLVDLSGKILDNDLTANLSTWPFFKTRRQAIQTLRKIFNVRSSSFIGGMFTSTEFLVEKK